jgi:hypothetical protein
MSGFVEERNKSPHAKGLVLGVGHIHVKTFGLRTRTGRLKREYLSSSRCKCCYGSPLLCFG